MKLQYRYLFTRKPGAPAIKVSPEDYDRLAAKTWYIGNGYALATVRPAGGRTTLYLHRFALGLQPGESQVVDHIDGDPLNNTRGNLRLCTQQQNSCNKRRSKRNTSGFKGVCWHQGNKNWMAYIKAGYAQITLGYFSTPEEAHQAYCAAANRLHGAFARSA